MTLIYTKAPYTTMAVKKPYSGHKYTLRPLSTVRVVQMALVSMRIQAKEATYKFQEMHLRQVAHSSGRKGQETGILKAHLSDTWVSSIRCKTLLRRNPAALLPYLLPPVMSHWVSVCRGLYQGQNKGWQEKGKERQGRRGIYQEETKQFEC